LNALTAIACFESFIFDKYPDSGSQNYKGLAKKVVLSMKSKGE
jgi:hypothetical protein